MTLNEGTGLGLRSPLPSSPGFRSFLRENAFLLGLMIFYVLFQLAFRDYGYHRDELYYIMMSRRLDFGYLELPFLAPFLMFLVRITLGTSLTAIHLLPALGGAAIIFLTFRMAKELGGSRPAASLASVAAAVAPQFIGSDAQYSYDYLDKLAWVLALYFLVRYFRREKDRDLYLFALAMGLGLMSKVSIVFLGACLFAAIALTRQRKVFGRTALYLAGGTAFAFALPYLAWQALHHWPTLEFYGRYVSGKISPYSPLGSLTTQVLNMNPLSFPLWAAGLVFFWIKDKGKYRPLTLAYVLLFALFYSIQAKAYMIAPFYSVLFAGGAAWLIDRVGKSPRRWGGVAYAGLIALFGLAVSPRARPILPVETYIKYAGGDLGAQEERLELGLLPQHFADRFGWPELAEKCRQAYESLSPAEKEEAVFLTGNYGEASAINFFGRAYGLPEALSGHNQYYLWGPRGHSGKVVIGFNIGSREELLKYFGSVEEAGRTDVRYAMPYEYDQPIYICRGIKVPLARAWPKTRSFG
jgi:hypothetical protein